MGQGIANSLDMHGLMFGLLYPAVLGSFFYSLLPPLIGHRNSASEARFNLKTIAASLVVAHFIIDFHLAYSLARAEYNLGSFILDLFVVGFLFRAFDALNVSEPGQALEVSRVGTAMALTYVFFLAWSLVTLDIETARLPLWAAEALGAALFLFVRANGSATFLCGSLAVMSVVMVIVGPLTVASP